jgi:hypothetical protein
MHKVSNVNDELNINNIKYIIIFFKESMRIKNKDKIPIPFHSRTTNSMHLTCFLKFCYIARVKRPWIQL